MTDRAPSDARPPATTGRSADARGRRGFGHSQDRRQVVQAEADLIRDAASRILGGETLVSIVQEWNEKGVRTTTGGPWHINALSALLIQPRLTPSIIDRATHERLVSLRRARQRPLPRPNTPNRRYLLTGFLRCWRCSSRLNATARFGVSAHPCYRCPSRGAGGCSGAIIRTNLAERSALDAIVRRLDDPEFARWLQGQADRLAEEEQALTALLKRALTSGADEDQGAQLWVEGRIDGLAWRALKTELERWADERPSGLACRKLIARQRELCGRGSAVAERWEGMTLDDQRSVVDTVVDYFVVWPAARPRNSFSPERLTPVWRGS